MAKPSYALDPYYMSEFSDTDSDDSTVEPIDEQEIYGKHLCYYAFLANFGLYANSRSRNAKGMASACDASGLG